MKSSKSSAKGSPRGKTGEVKENNTARIKQHLDHNLYLDKLLARRHKLLSSQPLQSTSNQAGGGPNRIAWPVIYSVCEFVIGAVMSANDAKKQQDMLDALHRIEDGLDAIQSQLRDIESRIDEIISILQKLLPEIQKIVDGALLKSSIANYASQGKSATSTIQTYMQNPNWAEQHLDDIKYALKQIQDSIYGILGAGSDPLTVDAYIRIMPLFAIMLNTWDARERIAAGTASERYDPVPFRDSRVFTVVSKWLEDFMALAQKTLGDATTDIANTHCPGNGPDKDIYSFDGATFTKVSKQDENLFRHDPFSYDIITLKISQWVQDHPWEPRRLVWMDASLGERPNPQLKNNAQFGHAAYLTCCRLWSALDGDRNTVEQLKDINSIHTDLRNSLATI